MKLLLLVLALAFVSCSSGSKKMDDKTVKKTTTTTKEEVKTAVKKEVEKMTAKKKTTSGEGKVTNCTYPGDDRVIENRFAEGGGCEVLYTKNGETKTIATAQNELDYCQEVYERVSTKLSGAGFTCK